MRPIELLSQLVNHNAPSGPAVIPAGAPIPGYTVTFPAPEAAAAPTDGTRPTTDRPTNNAVAANPSPHVRRLDIATRRFTLRVAPIDTRCRHQPTIGSALPPIGDA